MRGSSASQPGCVSVLAHLSPLSWHSRVDGVQFGQGPLAICLPCGLIRSSIFLARCNLLCRAVCRHRQGPIEPEPACPTLPPPIAASCNTGRCGLRSLRVSPMCGSILLGQGVGAPTAALLPPARSAPEGDPHTLGFARSHARHFRRSRTPRSAGFSAAPPLALLRTAASCNRGGYHGGARATSASSSIIHRRLTY